MSAGYWPGAYSWELVMRAEKTISDETLHRLWSEIAMLRREVEQAERNKNISQLQLTSAIAASKAQLQFRTNRDR
jgi:hypothetical protein